MKPRTVPEYLDSTSNILEESARLLLKHGHFEMSVYATKELKRSEGYDIEDRVGMCAKILILSGASMLAQLPQFGV